MEKRLFSLHQKSMILFCVVSLRLVINLFYPPSRPSHPHQKSQLPPDLAPGLEGITALLRALGRDHLIALVTQTTLPCLLAHRRFPLFLETLIEHNSSKTYPASNRIITPRIRRPTKRLAMGRDLLYRVLEEARRFGVLGRACVGLPGPDERLW